MSKELDTYIKLRYGNVELTGQYFLSLPDDLCEHIIREEYPNHIKQIFTYRNQSNAGIVLWTLVDFEAYITQDTNFIIEKLRKSIIRFILDE